VKLTAGKKAGKDYFVSGNRLKTVVEMLKLIHYSVLNVRKKVNI